MRLLPEPGPARTLALSTLVNTIGRGTWLTVSALFLTRSVGLTVAQVGIGLTVTALVSLVASTPMGYLADRYGPRGMQLAALLASAAFTAALVAVRSFPAFLAVGVLMAVAARAARRAGAVIAVSCLLFAASGGVPTPVAVALLLAGALVHVVGELWHAAAGWGVSFGLAPAHAQGLTTAPVSMGSHCRM